MIRTQNLCSGYDKHTIIHDVYFEARDDCLTAIVGANGSGKSTLLKSVCGLCTVHSGHISYGAKDITGTPTHRLSELGISYMSQVHNVFADLSVHENIVIAASPDKPELDRIFGIFPMLEKFKTTKASRLSGGQRQLLAMAMMITKSPRAMLYDEPTAGLSPRNAQVILDKIRQVQQTLGCCCILVEQNVRAALAIADYCYLLAGGRVRWSGNPGDLLGDRDLASKYLGIEP